MILGSVLVVFGKIFEASIVYQIPNAIFLYLSINNQDYFGATTIAIGLSLGLTTIYLMQKGVLNKGLK